MTFESVRVDWDPVPETFILGYMVLVTNTSFTELVVWSKSFIQIAGLHSNSTYVIKVYPFHGLTDERSIAESSQSITVTIDPDEGKAV